MGVWFDVFVSINELLFNSALSSDPLYRAMALFRHGALRLLFIPQYSVAATSSPNVFLYARLTNSIQFIYLLFKDTPLLDCVGGHNIHVSIIPSFLAFAYLGPLIYSLTLIVSSSYVVN